MTAAIQWGLTAALSAHLERDGHRFGVIVQPMLGQWHAVALVTPVTPDGESDTMAVEAALMAHAHQNLGLHDTLELARAAAVDFMTTAPAPSIRCECDDVIAGPEVSQ